MKSFAAGLVLLLGLAGVTGCVVSVGSESGESVAGRHEVPKPPPVVVLPGNSEDSAVMAEIDAAGKLSFDNGKGTALRNVAVRPSLTPAAQVHLVGTTLRVMSFDAGKVSVLLALIENPAFSPAAKESIFRQLERLSFDASRSQVMDAIQRKTAGQ